MKYLSNSTFTLMVTKMLVLILLHVYLNKWILLVHNHFINYFSYKHGGALIWDKLLFATLRWIKIDNFKHEITLVLAPYWRLMPSSCLVLHFCFWTFSCLVDALLYVLLSKIIFIKSCSVLFAWNFEWLKELGSIWGVRVKYFAAWIFRLTRYEQRGE